MKRRLTAVVPARSEVLLLSKAEVLEGIEDNLAMHFTWGPERAAGMRVHSDASFTLVDTGLPSAHFNAVCRTSPPTGHLAQWVAKVPLWFAQNPAPFTWWVGPTAQAGGLPQALEQAHFHRHQSWTALAAPLSALPALDHLPLWLEVHRVETLPQLEAYAALQAINAVPVDPWVNEYYDLTATHLLSPASPLHFYVGYLDGVPVTAAEAVETAAIAGVYNVVTLEAHRRQGLATAMALTALRNAAATGCTTGVLVAPPHLAPGYQRLGFVAQGEFASYSLVPPLSP